MKLPALHSTPYEVELLASGASPRPDWTSIVKATFALGASGVSRAITKEQHLPLAGADKHTGDPAVTAVRYESDFVPFKPRADALCVGKAYAPRGIPLPECTIGFGVGSRFKTIRVIGNRRWVPALGGLTHRMTDPEPFKSLPVSFDYAFGGKDAGKPDGFRAFAPNPVGKGYSESGGGLNNLALPNLEDPGEAIKSWRSRPKPMSFGPVGRTWEPRISRVGTYDRRWLKERAPKPPEDFDPLFYNCAPADQQIKGYLRGDEEVRVQNMHPEHSDFRFRLPGILVRAFLDKNVGASSQFQEIVMNLDTLWVDMEALQFVLVWRGRFSAAGLQGNEPVLVVEERLDSAPLSLESYRPELLRYLAEEQEPERVVAEAEAELTKMEEQRAAELAALAQAAETPKE